MADLVKKVKLEVIADSAEAQKKLDAITLKADKLRELNPEIKVKIDTMEASAKLAVFREELKAATRKATVTIDEKVGKRGLIGRLLFGASGGTDNPGGLLGSLGSAGPLGGIATSPAGIAGLVVAVGALLPELGGIVAGLSAATAGVGAFGLLALPTLNKIKTAYTSIDAAQKKYNAAVALNKENPTKTNAAAAAKALVALHVAQEGVTGSTKTAVTGIQSLVKTFEKMATAFAPTVFKVFNDGLKIANSLLPVLTPMAQAAGGAIDGLLKQFLKFTQSKGFQDWLGKFDKLIGPSIAAIGHGIELIITQVGKLITRFSARDVRHALNIFFDTIFGVVVALVKVIGWLMTGWDKASAAVAIAWRNIVKWSKQGASNVMGALNLVGRVFFVDIPHWISTGVAWFKSLPGKILQAIGNLGGLLVNAGKSIISGLISGIQSMLGPLGSVLGGITHLIPNLKGPIEKDRMLLHPAGQAIMDGLIGGISGRTPQLAQQLARTTSVIQRGVGPAGGAGSRGGRIVLEVRAAPGGAYGNFLAGEIKKYVHARGGGDVQVAFGRTA